MSGPSRRDLAEALERLLRRDRCRRIHVHRLEDEGEPLVEVAFSFDDDRPGLESALAFLDWAGKRSALRRAICTRHPYWVRAEILLDEASEERGVPELVRQEIETACRRGTLLHPIRYDARPREKEALPERPPFPGSAPEVEPSLPERDDALESRLDRLDRSCEAGRFDEALETIDLLLEERPGRPPRLLHMKGLCLDHLGRHEEAEALLREAAEANPDEATYLYDLAVCLTMREEKEEALATYEKVLTVDPSHGDATNNAAWLCHDLGRERDALHHFARLLDAEAPGSPRRDHAEELWPALVTPLRLEVNDLLGAAETEEAVPWVRARLADVLAPLVGRRRLLCAFDGEGWILRDPDGSRSWRIDGIRDRWTLRDLSSKRPLLAHPPEKPPQAEPSPRP